MLVTLYGNFKYVKALLASNMISFKYKNYLSLFVVNVSNLDINKFILKLLYDHD